MPFISSYTSSSRGLSSLGTGGSSYSRYSTPHYFSFLTSTYQNPLPYPQTVAGPMLIHAFLPFACFSLDPFCIIWKHFFPDNQTSFDTSARSILLLLSRDKCVQRYFCMLVVGLSACVVCINSYFCPRGLQYVCVCVVASMFFFLLLCPRRRLELRHLTDPGVSHTSPNIPGALQRCSLILKHLLNPCVAVFCIFFSSTRVVGILTNDSSPMLFSMA